jgi:hypothetical protein
MKLTAVETDRQCGEAISNRASIRWKQLMTSSKVVLAADGRIP